MISDAKKNSNNNKRNTPIKWKKGSRMWNFLNKQERLQRQLVWFTDMVRVATTREGLFLEPQRQSDHFQLQTFAWEVRINVPPLEASDTQQPFLQQPPRTEVVKVERRLFAKCINSSPGFSLLPLTSSLPVKGRLWWASLKTLLPAREISQLFFFFFTLKG